MRLVKGRALAVEDRTRTTLDVKQDVVRAASRFNFSDSRDWGTRSYDVACLLRLVAEALTIPPTPSDKAQIRLAVLRLLRGCHDTLLDTMD